MTGSQRAEAARQGERPRAGRRQVDSIGVRRLRHGGSIARRCGWLLLGLTAAPGAGAQAQSAAPDRTAPSPVPVVAAIFGEAGTAEADRLLALFLERLSLEPEGEDVRIVEGDLASAEAWSVPAVRLRQSSAWNFGTVNYGTVNYGTVGEIGVGVTLTLPLLDPEGAAREELLARRLELARHNAAAERDRRAHEFLRTLRLLAHVEEVVEVMEEHRRGLDGFLPELTGLALRPDTGPLDGQQLGYLELLESLQRARGERTLLWELVASKSGVAPPSGGSFRLGRPSLPAAETAGTECRDGNEDARRAELVRRQAVAASAAEAARQEAHISLDLSGDLRYRFPSDGAGEPWLADLRLSLRASLPPFAGARSGVLTLDASPTGIDQTAVLDWPGSAGAMREAAGEGADMAHRRSLEEAELALSRALVARDDADSLVALRGAALAAADARLVRAGVRAGPAELEGVSQARIALLNAELELDLAVIALAEACGLPIRPVPRPPPA
jgi:hypothetical protein